METKNEYREIGKSALRAYALMAAGVYISALAYCYLTQHFFELKLVAGAVIGLAFLIIRTYKSM